MPSIAPSTQASADKVADLKQANGTSSSSSRFVVEPLKPTGALKSYPHSPLTTALGEEFEKSVRLKEILALPKEQGDKVLKDLAILGELGLSSSISRRRSRCETAPASLSMTARVLMRRANVQSRGEVSSSSKIKTISFPKTSASCVSDSENLPESLKMRLSTCEANLHDLAPPTTSPRR